VTLDELFPEGGRVLLTGGGKEFVERLGAAGKKRDKASTWLAQWLIGLTHKQVQNVLRSDPEGIEVM